MKRLYAIAFCIACVIDLYPQDKLTLEYENGDTYYGNVYINIKQTHIDNSKQIIRKISQGTIKRQGQSTYISIDGKEYEVAWEQEIKGLSKAVVLKQESSIINCYCIERHGQGIYTSAKGDKYEGKWFHNKRLGFGVLIWANGDKYEGEWKDNLRDGKGTFHSPKDNTLYIGDFKNDKYDGQGEVKWGEGWYYIGSFVEGKMRGRGVLTQNDDYRYEGDFVDNKKEGKGTEKSDNGVYIGGFHNDRYEGEGEYRYLNGELYIGSFKNGQRNGKGTYKWPNGSSYEGMWENGKRHGSGHYTYANGRKVSGVWCDDKLPEHNDIRIPCSLVPYFSGFSTEGEDGGNFQGDELLCSYGIMDQINEGWAIQFMFSQKRIAQLQKVLNVTNKGIRCRVSMWEDEQMTRPLNTITWSGKTKIMDGIFNFNEAIEDKLMPISASWSKNSFTFDIPELKTFSIFLPNRLRSHMNNISPHDIHNKTIFYLKYEFSADGGKTYRTFGDWYRPHKACFEVVPKDDPQNSKKDRFKTLDQKGAEDFF